MKKRMPRYGDIRFSSLLAIMAMAVKHTDRITQRMKKELFAKFESFNMTEKYISDPKMDVTAQIAEDIKTSLATSSL